jgi:hypothetical protein
MGALTQQVIGRFFRNGVTRPVASVAAGGLCLVGPTVGRVRNGQEMKGGQYR